MFLRLEVEEDDEFNRCFVEAQRLADLLKLKIKFEFESFHNVFDNEVLPSEEY